MENKYKVSNVKTGKFLVLKDRTTAVEFWQEQKPVEDWVITKIDGEGNKDNRTCVTIDVDPMGYKFMHVHEPAHVSVTISEYGHVHVNVNESCVFTVKSAKALNLNIDNIKLQPKQ